VTVRDNAAVAMPAGPWPTATATSSVARRTIEACQRSAGGILLEDRSASAAAAARDKAQGVVDRAVVERKLRRAGRATLGRDADHRRTDAWL
jgi:hypothetical protein